MSTESQSSPSLSWQARIRALQTVEMTLGKGEWLCETVNSGTNWVSAEWLHGAQAASTGPQPGTDPTPSALEGKVLTAGPPEGVPTRFLWRKPGWKIDKQFYDQSLTMPVALRKIKQKTWWTDVIIKVLHICTTLCTTNQNARYLLMCCAGGKKDFRL